METVGCTATTLLPHRGLHNSFCNAAAIPWSLSTVSAPIVNAPISSNGQCYTVTSKNKNDITFNRNIGFCLPNVPGLQERWFPTTSLQPAAAQQFPPTKEIQVNKSLQGPDLSSTRGLSSKHRPIPSLLPRANCSSTSSVSIIHIQRDCVPVDVSTIRTGHGSTGLCSTHKLGGFLPEGQGHTDNCIPGRFPLCPPRSGASSGASPFCHSTPPISRMAGKFQQVSSGSKTGNGFSGHHMEHKIAANVLAKGKGIVYFQSTPVHHPKTPLVSKVGPSSDWGSKFCSVRGSSWSSPSATDSTSCTIITPHQTPSMVACTPAGDQGAALVAQKSEPLVVVPSSHESSFHVNRCVGPSMGGRDIRNLQSGPVVTCSTGLAHQPKGALCSPSSNSGQQCAPTKPHCGLTDRQQDGSCLHPQTRGSPVTFSTSGDREALPAHVIPQHSRPAILYPRKTEYPSGQSLPGHSSPRLASWLVDHTYCLSALGHPRDRPICDKPVKGGQFICVTGQQRSPSNLHRCLFQTMELRPSLGLSAASSASPSFTSHELVNRSLPGSGPQVAKGILESRPQIKSSSTPVGDQGPQAASDRPDHRSTPSPSRGYDLGDLVDTGWGQQVADWSENDRQLLTAAWRPSTRRSYRRPWARWISWASLSGTDPYNPLPKDLARFLAHLHQSEGLALRSILVHKSVVATLSNPDQSSHISSHPVVTKMIKGIAASCPGQPSRMIWNPSDLLEWIRSHPPSCESFFEISRHLAILLLLASGRRVHDLTLLRVDPLHLQQTTDFIVFWPSFGSKTDSASFQQSGWRFSSSSLEGNLWSVPHWLAIFLDLRARRCGSQRFDSLFISTMGTVRPASRAVIGGWVSTLLSAAGLPFSAGSIRSAVNSSLARADLPIDTILRRGNWRSADTFLRHYYRPLACNSSRTQTVNPVSTGFTPEV